MQMWCGYPGSLISKIENRLIMHVTGQKWVYDSTKKLFLINAGQYAKKYGENFKGGKP